MNDTPHEVVNPEVLSNEDGTMWVSTDHDAETAAAAMNATADEGWLDYPIEAEDLIRVAMRPMTVEEAARYGDAGDIECPLDNPAKTGDFWRWAE